MTRRFPRLWMDQETSCRSKPSNASLLTGSWLSSEQVQTTSFDLDAGASGSAACKRWEIISQRLIEKDVALSKREFFPRDPACMLP